MNYYLAVLKKYADFSGRARRKEYWMFTLFHLIFLIAAAIIDTVIGTTLGALPYGFVYAIYSLALFIPGLAVMVRRLHDVGKGGGWFFILFIPIVGAIWFLVLMCTNGDAGENRFGPDPKTDNFVGSESLDGHLTN